MKLAIEEAKKARKSGDYPIGAVIVSGGTVLVSTGNKSKKKKDATQHAEIAAIQSASKLYGRKQLEKSIMYTTNEPCVMCMGAIIYARMKGLIFGARIQDMKKHKSETGSKHSWRTININTQTILGKSEHDLQLVGDFMRKECQELFFLLK